MSEAMVDTLASVPVHPSAPGASVEIVDSGCDAWRWGGRSDTGGVIRAPLIPFDGELREKRA
jgi:hypothetical protein